jgi:hypothetical protein
LTGCIFTLAGSMVTTYRATGGVLSGAPPSTL